MCTGYPQYNRKPQVSNCVLLDEYRHNLSAALGHLPGDEEDLEEEVVGVVVDRDPMLVRAIK